MCFISRKIKNNHSFFFPRRGGTTCSLELAGSLDPANFSETSMDIKVCVLPCIRLLDSLISTLTGNFWSYSGQKSQLRTLNTSYFTRAAAKASLFSEIQPRQLSCSLASWRDMVAFQNMKTSLLQTAWAVSHVLLAPLLYRYKTTFCPNRCGGVNTQAG